MEKCPGPDGWGVMSQPGDKKLELSSFVYTHMGENALSSCGLLGLNLFYRDFDQSKSGFARKPNPEAAMHLMEQLLRLVSQKRPTILGSEPGY